MRRALSAVAAARAIAVVLAVVLALVLALAAPVLAATSYKKPHARRHHVSRHWHGYGFLPGYRPPGVIERERAEHYWSSHPPYYGLATPRYYHGRWNGGGFGPCYTQTPIGYMWNCGP